MKEIKIIEKVTFSFGHMENAKNVAIALATNGYYVKIRQDMGCYVLEVYSDRLKNKDI